MGGPWRQHGGTRAPCSFEAGKFTSPLRPAKSFIKHLHS